MLLLGPNFVNFGEGTFTILVIYTYFLLIHEGGNLLLSALLLIS